MGCSRSITTIVGSVLKGYRSLPQSKALRIGLEAIVSVKVIDA